MIARTPTMKGVIAASTCGAGFGHAVGTGSAGDSTGCRQREREVKCIILGSVVGCSALPAIAADGAVSVGSLVQVVLGLVLVLVVMAGSAWLLKRYGTMQRGQGGAVRIIGGTAVGQRERVVLLEVDDTWLVVGVAPGHLSALHSMPKGSTSGGITIPATADVATASSGSHTDAAREIRTGRKDMNGPFSMWLNQLMEKCSGEFRR